MIARVSRHAWLLLVLASVGWGQLPKVATPSWRLGSALRPGYETWVVPEYNGPSGATARRYVGLVRNAATVGVHWLWWLPNSSVVAVLTGDPRVSPPHYGIDVGFHVLHCEQLAGPAEGVLLMGLDPTGQGSVSKWSWAADADPASGSVTAICSLPAGAIPARASIVSQLLYVLDLQAHSVIRYQDANQDGVFETLDGSFSVSVSPDGVPIGVHGFRGFRPSSSPGAVTRLDVRPLPHAIGQSVAAEIIFSGGVFSLATTPAKLQQGTQRLGILRELVEGQAMVRVVGDPGEFVRVMDVGGASPQAISLVAQVPSSGYADLPLLTPLTMGQRVQVAVSGSGARASSERVVDRSHGVIVAVDERHVPSGGALGLTVVGWRAGDEVWLKAGNTDHPCAAKQTAANKVKVTLPSLGKLGPPTTTVNGLLYVKRPANGETSSRIGIGVRYLP